MTGPSLPPPAWQSQGAPGLAGPAGPLPTERPPRAPDGPSLRGWQRFAFRALLAGLGLLRRLPDKPLYRSAYTIGTGLYLLMPERRARVRSNLERVCRWLVEQGQAVPRVERAAHDPAALERLVRATFGHWLVTYVEAALGPRYSSDELRRRLVPAHAATSAEALSVRPPGEVGPIHLSMHFGSVDLSALYGTRVGHLPVTGPMESVAHPLARAWFDHVRGELGVTIVPLGGAAQELTAALRRGEAVGLVADRNIVGSGAQVELCGAPARLPIGPAVLSVQTGATIYLQAIERTGPGAWLGHTVAIRPEPGLSRRDATRSIIEQEARAFERIIARAPEQWTTLFFPIWKGEEGS